MQIRSWVQARRGTQAFSELSEKHGSLPPLVAGGWYDAEALLSIIEDAASMEKISVDQAVSEIARANARQDLKTVYRPFLRVLSPRHVLKFLPRLWRQYFQFGSVVVLENELGSVELLTCDVPGRFVPWVRGGWRGFLPETILASGGKAPRIGSLEVRSAGSDSWEVRVRASYEGSR